MKKVFTILYLLLSIKIFAQKNVLCDTVYDYPETSAYFKNDNIGLMKYINTKLAPILIECQTESQLIASMNIVLTINKYGKVMAADFPKMTFESTIQFLKNSYELKFGDNTFGNWFKLLPENDVQIKGLRTLRHFEAHVEIKPALRHIYWKPSDDIITLTFKLWKLTSNDVLNLKNSTIEDCTRSFSLEYFGLKL